MDNSIFDHAFPAWNPGPPVSIERKFHTAYFTCSVSFRPAISSICSLYT